MGAPAAIAMVGAIASKVNHGNIKVLTWDKKEIATMRLTFQFKEGA